MTELLMVKQPFIFAVIDMVWCYFTQVFVHTVQVINFQ